MYKISFNLKSFDLNSLVQIEAYLSSIFSFFQIHLSKEKRKPQKIQKFTVLRSPHIDKKSREQFQIISHKKTLVLHLSDKNLVFLIIEILKDLQFVGVELNLILEISTVLKAPIPILR